MPAAFADLPVRLGHKIECSAAYPATNFDVLFGAVSDGTDECGTLGIVSRKFALLGI